MKKLSCSIVSILLLSISLNAQSVDTDVVHIEKMKERVSEASLEGKKEANSANFMKNKIFQRAQKKAMSGDVNAQYALGNMYYIGAATDIDYKEGLKWFKEAASKGHMQSEYELGYIYYEGRGVKKDLKEALKWFKRAADKGDSKSQLILADIYYSGESGKKDYEKAYYWYKITADLDYPKAQYRLAEMFYNGYGVGKNRKKSAYWLKRASAQSYADAQYKLAQMYLEEDGVKKDVDMAKKLFSLAYLNGNKDAKDAIIKNSWELPKPTDAKYLKE